MEYSDLKRKEINNLVANGECVLPKSPDLNRIRNVTVEIQERVWYKNKEL